jgi:hypothetical protein
MQRTPQGTNRCRLFRSQFLSDGEEIGYFKLPTMAEVDG